MKKRFLIGSLSILSMGAMSLGLFLMLVLPQEFPFGNRLFQWRHQSFDHLAFHLAGWQFEAGDSLLVFASAGRADSVSVSLYEVRGRDTVFQGLRMPISFQAVSDSVAVAGTGWQPSFALPLPQSLAAGWYVLMLKSATHTQRQSLFVRPANDRELRRVAWLFSTNTWNAYNPWGGQSLYSSPPTGRVSFLRPQPCSDPDLPNTLANHQLHFQSAGKDRYLAALLDSAGIGYDAYAMDELHHSPARLARYDAIVLSTHPEYWSREMMEHLNICLDSGASLICLAGNVAAYEGVISAGYMSLADRRDSSFWHQLDTLQIRPFGIQYSFLGFQTYAPYQVQADSSWVWTDTGLEKGELFGSVSDSYDYTFREAGYLKRLRLLIGQPPLGAASGLEIDRRYTHTPDNWVQLAQGLNPNAQDLGQVYPDPLPAPLAWNGQGGADMGYYEHAGGGLVFHVGSIAFTGSIPYDRQIQQIVLNVFHHVLGQ